jgi:signal transduction histidine kinase
MDADGDGPVGRTLAAVATSGGQSLGAADGTDSALRTRPLNLAVATSVAGSVLVFVAIALGALWAFQAAAVAQAKNEAGLFGEVAARVALAPFLTDELIAGDPEAIAEMDGAWAAFQTEAQVVALKIWAGDSSTQESEVIWANDPRLIGQYFELEPQDHALFESLGATVAISDLDKEENVFEVEAGTDRLVEVYFGAVTNTGTPIVVETYYPYELVTERTIAFRNRFLPLLITGLALLTLAQVPLALKLARRLGRYQRERERLLERVIDASDAERRRIAAEVHDGAVQDLIGISYTLAAKSDEAPPPLDGTLRGLAASTRTTVRSLRSLLQSIYPIEVPPEGWAAGIEDLVTTLRERGVDVELDIPSARLTRMDELLLLRVAREALRNAATHAQATRVTVRMRNQLGRLSLEVKDDGQGFTVDEADTSRRDGHLGLQLLSDLAVDAGASLLVDSHPGEGTTVRLELVGQR